MARIASIVGILTYGIFGKYPVCAKISVQQSASIYEYKGISAVNALSLGMNTISSVADLDFDIHGAEIKHSQLSRGLFRGELQRVMFKNSVFDSGLYNQCLCGKGVMPADAFTFIYIYELTGDGYLNKHAISKGVWLYQPGDEMLASLPGDFQWCSLSINTTELERHLDAAKLDIKQYRRLGTGPVNHSDPKALELLLNRIIFNSRVSGVVGNADLLEEKLLFAFLDAIGLEPSSCIETRSQCSILNRAEDQLRSSMDAPVSTTSLSYQVGCSRRKIEGVFKEAHGMGPIAFHRLLRLNEAHRHLIESKGSPGTVSNTATQFGFTHLGRFSADYKTAFGEYPKQTSKCRSSAKGFPIY